jgi:gamma-glutamylcyclotransferase (GGCT)/AIG2-like uncharacterized protein YtfP
MRLFFYGTLMAGSGHPVAETVHRRLMPVGPALARGRLYCVPDPEGAYPILILDPAGADVPGIVYEATPGFAAADLAMLDAYEICDPSDPDGSDYLRRTIPLTTADGNRSDAEAYVHVRALPEGAFPIDRWPIASV